MKDKGRLIMLFFIGSEAFFFICLIIAYVYYRNFSNATDTVTANLNVPQASVLTGCLVLSSFTFVLGKKALQNQNRKRFNWAIAITLLLAVIFMAGQGKEYIDLYHKQITLSKDVFGGSFFTLTGFHGFHVILGILTISIMYGMSFFKFEILTAASINSIEIYWHFVDVVWLFVFFFVYIKPLL